MTVRSELLARLRGDGSHTPLYLPDLTLWYDWHAKHGSLPATWQGYSLAQVTRALGAPVWLPAAHRRVDGPSVRITTTEQGGERVIRSETAAGTLVARWNPGPDGAWWQSEYPVKRATDLPAVLELAKARAYVFDLNWPVLEAEVGDDGIVAIEIPRRPLSDLLHEYLGWGDGLMLLVEERAAIRQIVDVLEEKLQQFVAELAPVPAAVVLSPDNLDGQYISPRLYREYLAGSYQRTAEAMHAQGKQLIVHVGGPAQRLLAPLAAAGVDGVEGVAGPPQGDTSLAEARALAGPGLTLWGGIPQDYVLGTHGYATFENAVLAAAQEAAADPRTILGVADRVPVDAAVDRLEAVVRLVSTV